MDDEEITRPELQGIFDEFKRIRDAYVAMKAYCVTQGQVLSLEYERTQRMKENLEKLMEAYQFLTNRYKVDVEKLQKENETLCKTIEGLKEQCDYLRLIATDRNSSDQQTFQMQDEIEVLKANLLLQEEKHNEDVALLRQKHSDEIQRYKMLLNSRVATHQNKKREQPKTAKKTKENVPPFFRWPVLDIEKVNATPMDIEEAIGDFGKGNKKRKLFSENSDTPINIV
ncbi:uncharacterized protein LOC122402954 [Colletes gigas]|uniref:uncharacterized protein LOC122402954 n=1 Tax=Colletes gigas TaxID=935657 RepID=UPI001C9B649D|nr:uncharacterized protein LOC122402954 [Colletes gigas]